MRELFLHNNFLFQTQPNTYYYFGNAEVQHILSPSTGQRAKAEKVAHPPSSHPFDLDRASHLELFSWSDSPHPVSHMHKKAQWLWDPSCSHRVILTELSTSRSFSTDHIQPQTLLAPTRDLSRLSPRQRLTRRPLGVHWSLSALKSMMSKIFRARITPANWSICTLTSPPVPKQKQIFCKILQLWRCQGVKSEAEDRTVLRNKILWEDSWQSAALVALGRAQVLCWLWAVPGQPCLSFSPWLLSSGIPRADEWHALCSSGNPTMALVEQACVLLQPFSLPDKHWKDCTALYTGLPHHRAKQIHLWSALIKVFHFTSSSWKTTLLGDGGVDFFFLWGFFTVFMCVGFLGFLLLFCWGVFVCFFGGKVWVLLFGVFFQFIFKRQINDLFIPGS